MKAAWIALVSTLLLGLTAPARADDDLPPVGHSRFDELVGDRPVPYPFNRLAETINRQMRADPGGLPPLKITLIPLGRSLQRDAGAPDFFRIPRVVAAADGANRRGFAPLKDRLFLGFHEQGEVIEVISYNDAAARFEFQVVRDYAPGKAPQVFHARRDLCLACHQNAAPIFSRPLWDETPANPAIAARLRETGRDFYGIKVTGTDIAYLIDAATDRANKFAIWQLLWQQGCGEGDEGDTCRQEAFTTALAYARSLRLPAPTALPRLDQTWRALWPDGLPIPNPDLPNRDPLAMLTDPANDPLLLRPPLELWRAPDKTAFVVGLAGMLDPAAVERLERAELSTPLERLRARGAFAARPFGPNLLDALLAQIGKPRLAAHTHLPRPRLEPTTAARGEDPLTTPFRANCAACHDTTLPHPPNFLHGNPAAVAEQLDQCAERIFVRLSQADLPEAARSRPPMPPAAALLGRGIDPGHWVASPEFAALKAAAQARLGDRDPQALLRQPYEQLRPCLPSSLRAEHTP
ncbi:MAG: hypothetical protein AB7S51_10280 [Porticoccaceae bacterium]